MRKIIYLIHIKEMRSIDEWIYMNHQLIKK